jgi:Tfp pilus assembly protein PilZ
VEQRTFIVPSQGHASYENKAQSGRHTTCVAAETMLQEVVDCEIVRSKGFVLLASKAELRADGMVLETKEEIVAGEEVIVSACLTDGGTWVDAVARVVHVSQRDGTRRVAIVFVQIDEGDRELVVDDDLERLLSEPPPPPPPAVLH